jgi:hypothetical protein
MSKMVKCKSCGHTVAYTAFTCPNCGELHPSIRLGRAFAWLFGAIVVLAILFAVFVPKEPDYASLSSEQRKGIVQARICGILSLNEGADPASPEKLTDGIAADLGISRKVAALIGKQAIEVLQACRFSCKN